MLGKRRKNCLMRRASMTVKRSHDPRVVEHGASMPSSFSTDWNHTPSMASQFLA